MSNRKPKPHITAIINTCPDTFLQNVTIGAGRAFTLVELLLGLIIFSIVALSLYGMFTNGIKVEAKAKYIHETYQEAYTAFDMLERELSNAIKYDFSGFSSTYSKYSTQTAFIGRSNELTFLLPTAQGIDRVHYYSAKHSLLRQQMPLSEFLNQSNPAWQEEIISTGLAPTVPSGLAPTAASGLRFAYASLKDQGQVQGGLQQLQWQNQWQQAGLPLAVRVTLTLFDPAHPKEGVVLTREIYLPVNI